MGIKTKEINFVNLLEPYKEGGIEDDPVERTLETITSKLVISYRLPIPVVGAAIFKVFFAMANEGLEFKGNGTYGSKGRELFSCIKAQAIDMAKKGTTEAVLEEIGNMTSCVDMKCKKRAKIESEISRWWK